MEKFKHLNVVLLAALSLALSVNVNAQMPVPLLDSAETEHVKTEKQKPKKAPQKSNGKQTGGGKTIDEAIAVRGKVIEKHPLPIGGITAWLVEASNGSRMVLYSTQDGQALFVGAVWNAQTGAQEAPPFAPKAPSQVTFPQPIGYKGAANPSEVYARIKSKVDTQRAADAAQMPPSVPALSGKFTGEIPESIRTVASLAGVTEGKGGVADTLYVLYDPRCPYCRKAYQTTRTYISKGYTIKWIPVLALGASDSAAGEIAAILQAPEKERLELFRQSMSGRSPKVVQPERATLEALAYSYDYMTAVFEHAGDSAGVPVGFFLDHRTNKPRMTKGVSEGVILVDIFGNP